jgi:hypothetical protein
MYKWILESCLLIIFYLLKNAKSPMILSRITSHIVSHCSTNWAKGDLCWHSGGGYEPNMFQITLVRREYPLHSPHLKTHHTLMKISQLPVFNLTRFAILTTVGYLVGHKCNSRAYFISEKCNFPDGIRSQDLAIHCSTNWAEWNLH